MAAAHQLTVGIWNRLHQAPIQSNLALLFPGQGSQHVGMGSDLRQVAASAREVFERADAVLGLDLSRLCLEGPEDGLRQTANAQPAIMVASLACLSAALETGSLSRRPAFLAGHSLGEYTALVAAGSLAFEDALRLVQERGRLMQEAAQERPGGMAAILGLDEGQVGELCRLSGAEPCNYNSLSQTVIGGPPPAVAQASALARERGGKVLPLNVSGAFHTSLMEAAAEEFARAVDEVSIADPLIPVVGNVGAQPLTGADEVKAELKQQMLSPVRWHQSVATMAEAGVGAFVEIGPGRVLTALLKRAAPHLTAISISEATDLPSLRDV